MLNNPNLTINLLAGNGSFTEDDYGNPIEQKTNLEVFARVGQSKSPIHYQMPGIQITDIFLKGNVLSLNNAGIWIPDTLPLIFDLEIAANATLNLGNREYVGKFKFLPIVQPVFPSLTSTFGEVIFGYLNLSLRN
jgi:hypothetical protein